MTAADRAVAAVRMFILPAVTPFQKNFSGSATSCAIAIMYGSKNFLDDASSRAELVVVVIDNVAASEYAAGDIDDHELLEKSEVYGYDRDAVGTSYKKLVLNLRK